MRYKNSMFNYILDDKDRIILFNSYTQKIACSEKSETIKKIMARESGIDVEQEARMIADGFLVQEDENEVAKGKLKYYDKIYDKMLSLTIMPTEQCNFRCKYCYEKFEKGKMSEEVSAGVIKYLQKNMSSYSGLDISWFGGEPLLALDIIEKMSKEIYELCKKLKKPYLAGMTTNGYFLTPEILERLLKYRIYHYQITLDGTEHDHNRYRVLCDGSPTFNVIMGNLQRISKQVSSKRLRISIRVNLTQESYKNLDDFMELMNKEFGQDERFDIFVRPVGDWGGDRVQQIKADLFGQVTPFLAKLLEYKKKTPFKFGNYVKMLNGGVCYAAVRNNYILGSDGRIYKCTLHFDKEFNQIGKVLSNGVFYIDYAKLAKWITPDCVPEKCRGCFMAHACPGGQCAAQRMIAEKMTSINCGYEINDIDNLLRLICENPDESVIVY